MAVMLLGSRFSIGFWDAKLGTVGSEAYVYYAFDGFYRDTDRKQVESWCPF